MKTGSRRTTVNACVDGDDFSIVSKHTVVHTGDVSIADHVQHATFLHDTGGEATDVGPVEGQGRVGVVSQDTVGRGCAATDEDRAGVSNITTFDEHGVVGQCDVVHAGLDVHTITVDHHETLSVGRCASWAHTNGVAADAWSCVAA